MNRASMKLGVGNGVSKSSSSSNKFNRVQQYTFHREKNSNMTWKRKRPQQHETEQGKISSATQNLTRIGSNKLISSNCATSSSSIAPKSNRNNSIKRVKISRQESEEAHESDQSAGLTNFAYRQVQSKSICKPTTITKRRPMALIRVNPTSSTPVCPSILRGIPCTNEKCTKRHDVSRESVTPLCSFFQRNGSCLRQDCMFRHVKMNSRAEVCVNFSVKGFCEAPNCVLRHVRRKA